MVESSVEDSFEDRIAAEVTSLSTKLVTAVAKLSELEETLFHLHKENNQLKAQNTQLSNTANKYNDLLEEHTKLQSELKATKEREENAVAQNAKLQGEVEDLTASLFNEANQMVSNASRETYNFKIKNRKLIEEVEEKDTIIKDLQEQLSDLKQLFLKIEDKNKSYTPGATPSLEQEGFNGNSEDITSTDEGKATGAPLQLFCALYSPNVKSIRLDLKQFQSEFKPFIFHLIKPNFQFDLQNLKTLRFFKKIWNDELENSIQTPHLASTNFINRWQKGKSFWNYIVEGKAIIEPIKGVNETFKLTYEGQSTHKAPPVATRLPCSFCGESRDDTLDHCRLYSLKLLSSDISTAANDDSQGNPLCNYCLIKLRNICDFFAKLRLIHSNIYKLSQTNQFDDMGLVTNNFQFRKNLASSASDSELAETTTNKVIKLPIDEEAKLIKIYVMLTIIRSKIFWSKIGFWDTINNVTIANLDEMNHEVFQSLIYNEESEVSQQRMSSDATSISSNKIHNNETPSETVNIEKPSEMVNIETNPTNINTELSQLRTSRDEIPSTEPTEVILVRLEEPIESETTDNVNAADNTEAQEHTKDESETDGIKEEIKSDREISPNDSDDQNTKSTDNEEFIDSTDDFPNKESESLNQDQEESPDGLKRSKSKSKQFKKKINDDLDQTLAMLEESIQE